MAISGRVAPDARKTGTEPAPKTAAVSETASPTASFLPTPSEPFIPTAAPVASAARPPSKVSPGPNLTSTCPEAATMP